jgi:hypothetical protein
MKTTAFPNHRVNLTGQNDAPGKLPERSAPVITLVVVGVVDNDNRYWYSH